MKIFLPLLCILLCTARPVYLFSQCSGGTAPLTITYDTIVTGNGNSSNDFSFPKFPPSLGTLLSADIQSVVGLKYSYNLVNQTLSTNIFKTKIVRTDDISSDALDPSTVSAVNQTPYVPSIIGSLLALNYGPATMNYSLLNSVTDSRLVNFMGVGNVDFDYETGTSASVQGPLPWQLNFTSVNDTTHFSLTYRFCAASLLSSDLLYFTATSLKDKILLAWQQATIEENRAYDVQVSADAQNFITVASINENNAGLYNYAWMGNAAKKMYFRIEEKNASGEIKYSNIREAEISHATQADITVFPTLYTGGNLQVNFPYKADWHVDFYSAEGRKISESHQFDVYTAQIEVPAFLSNGIYSVEIFNTQTQQRKITRIIIKR